MTGDRFTDAAPLFVLGTLDADERVAFQEHVATCAECRAEVRAFEQVRDRIPLAVEERKPPPRVREALMAAVAPKPTMTPEVVRADGEDRKRWIWPVVLPLAAALVLGVGYWRASEQVRVERVRAEDESARAQDLTLRLAQSERRLQEMELREVQLRSLLANPDAHVVSLAGQKDAEVARARVFWNPATSEAIVTVAGLPTPPAGKAYQMWVIAGAAPVPAGVFSVAADGSAIFNLPRVSETKDVKTFAITVEPAQGVPAPTGPIVLAGQVT
jgi:anti-sigma-K factor RskA